MHVNKLVYLNKAECDKFSTLPWRRLQDRRTLTSLGYTGQEKSVCYAEYKNLLKTIRKKVTEILRGGDILREY